MKPLHARILEASQIHPEGQVLSPKFFLSLGSHAAILRCLSLLVQRGHLARISRGLYVRPVATMFGSQGFRLPEPYRVVQSLAAVTDEIIVRHGAYAANALGLTTQAPIREIFLTNGKARTLRLGTYQIEIRPASAWLLLLGTTAAGDAVRALDWMGEPSAMTNIAKLKNLLRESEWQILKSAQRDMPSWMAHAIFDQSQ